MAYTVYILYSISLDRYYVGFTGEDIAERLRKHISGTKGFSGKAIDWQIVYKEVYENKSLAIAREREIKSWKSRVRVEGLIKKG